MRQFEELKTFRTLAGPLKRPDHTCTSMNQLARWTGVQDDRARRTLTRLSEEFHDPLIEVRGKRYCLTQVGCELYAAVERLFAVGSQAGAEQHESLTVGLDQGLDSTLFVNAFAEFFQEWDGLVGVRVVPLDPEDLRQNSGATSFSIGWAGTEATPGCEFLDTPLTWTLLVPPVHRLAVADGPVSAEQLVSEDRVFLPTGPGETATAGFLNRVAPVNRCAVGSAGSVRALVAAGLGLGLDLAFCPPVPSGAFLRLPIAGLNPVRLGLLLPRKASAMSEPAKSLLDLIRTAGRLHLAAADPVPLVNEPEAVAG